jgi:probable rRNA maturation factor
LRLVLDVEVLGVRPDGAPGIERIERLCELAASCAAVKDAHIAIEFADSETIARLNAEHRGRFEPTDVLSFPIDGRAGHEGVPGELGDVVICPEHTADLSEAIVHGVLHLVGMDHETDRGEMLALQAELLSWVE